MNPPSSSLLLSRIEDAGLNASAPPQQLWMDGCLVRFSPGKAKRARCVNAVAPGLGPLDERLQSCERLYAAKGLPFVVRVTPFSQPGDLDERLAERGMIRFDETCVMVRDSLTDLTVAPPKGVSIHPIGIEAFAHRVGGYRGSPLAQRQAHSQRLSESPVPFFPFELRINGEAVACAEYALEDGIVGLYDVFVAEAERGRGLAFIMCAHLLADARAAGARHAYLQVELDNLPARAVYRRLGFRDGYQYHYRAKPG